MNSTRPDRREEDQLTRIRRALILPTLVAVALPLSLLMVGCGAGDTNIQVKDAPPVQPGETKPLPADVKKGGGKGSSGNMKFNPGASS
jgi:hypothetical protein